MSSDIISHYGSADLGDSLLARLDRTYGAALDATSLRGVDQFHLGGHLATQLVLDELDLDPDDVALDVGCGIGGVARELRARFGCTVDAVDLTPAFVDAARRLGERVGASEGITYQVADALALPFAADRFDAVLVVHVGMNIADKTAMLRELRRVARPSAPTVIYDIVRRTDASLTYPLPWAADRSMDHIEEEQAYVDAMGRAGLTFLSSTDRTDAVLAVIAQAAANPAPVALGDLMGEGWPTMFANLVAALRAGVVAPVHMAARA